MVSPALLALGSVAGVSLLSFVGILLFLLRSGSMQRALIYLVSFSTGALLGDVFIHILPQMPQGQDARSSYMVLLGGMVFSFAMEKIVHWRHCHILPTDTHEHCHHVGVMSLMGDAMHNFIDGVVIAAGFLASVPLGISTTLAVVFHEIPHEIGNIAILLHSGFARGRALWFNFLSALSAVLGALLTLAFAASVAHLQQFLLPFAAGNLLYIAGSDLIPELHKETGIRSGIWQLLCMIGGIVLMYGLLALE
jgi:zinc and cadmium transporter